MSHAITLGDVALVCGLLAAVVLMAFGALGTMAGGWTAVPDDQTSRIGCAMFLGGLALLVLCVTSIR